MFGSTKELQSNIDSLKKELTDVTLDKEKLFSRLEEAQNIIESLGLSLENDKKSILKKNSEYKKEVDVLKIQHKSDLEKIEKSVYHKVNTTLASMGVDVFVPEYFSDNKPDTDHQILSVFQSLSGNEKTEYYNKNKDAITRSLLNTPSK
jgi:hypothetical protein